MVVDGSQKPLQHSGGKLVLHNLPPSMGEGEKIKITESRGHGRRRSRNRGMGIGTCGTSATSFVRTVLAVTKAIEGFHSPSKLRTGLSQSNRGVTAAQQASTRASHRQIAAQRRGRPRASLSCLENNHQLHHTQEVCEKMVSFEIRV